MAITYDGTKPAASSLLSSAEVRGNFAAVPYFVAGSWAANGEMWLWSAGPTSVPDYYVLSGAGVAIVCTGVGQADAHSFVGDFAAKLTAGGGATGVLTQRLLGAATSYARTVVAQAALPFSVCWAVRCGSAAAARVKLTDGVVTAYSAYHSGSLVTGGYADGWELLTATLDLVAGMTSLDVSLEVAAGVAAWCDGLAAVPGPIAPLSYLPGRVVRRPLLIPITGTQAVVTTAAGVRFRHAHPFRVRNIRLLCGTAPTGAAIRVDVLKAGVSIFTGTFPEIAAAATTGSLVPNGTVEKRCFSAADTLTVDVTQVGSTIPGADLMVSVDLEWYERPQQQHLEPGE